MGRTTQAIRNVTNHFGARETGGSIGRQPTYGVENELTLDISVETFRWGTNTFNPGPFVLPAGSKVLGVKFFVDTNIVFSNPAANFVIKGGADTITVPGSAFVKGWYAVADASLTGVFKSTSIGTLVDTPLTVDTGGLLPTSVDPRVRFVIEYLKTTV